MTPLRSDRGQLALAIYRGDLVAAEAALAMLAATDVRWALAIQAARRAVNPPDPLPSTGSMLLPAPGAPFGAVLGDDVRERITRRQAA